MAEHLKNPTLSGGTYLYSVYKGVPPGTQMRVRSHTKREFNWLYVRK